MSSLAPRRRILLWAVAPLAVLMGAGAWLTFRPADTASTAAATSVERTLVVSSGDMEQTVSASGSIEPESTDDLSFSAAGTVTAVNVEAGQEVKAGQVVAVLESAELESAVAAAVSAVDDAEAALDSDQDADASNAQLTADETALESAEAQLDAAFEAMAGAQLVATIDGTVSAVNVTVGEQLGSGGTSGSGMTGSETGSGQSNSNLGSGVPDQSSASGGSGTDPHIQIITTESYVITLGLDSTDVASIEVGQSATVTPTSSSNSGGSGLRNGFPAFPGGFPGGAVQVGGGTAAPVDGATTPAATGAATTGTVTAVGKIADASSGVAKFPVEVTVSGHPAGFNAGAGADVDVAVERLADVIQVQSLAVTTADTGSTVVVRADGKDETRQVTTGLISRGMTQITEGLKAGETVVVTMPGGGPGGARATGGFTPPNVVVEGAGG